MLARAPDVEIRTNHGDRQRQAVARQRLRYGNDVRLDAGRFEREERTGTADAGLDIVHDEEHVVLVAELFDLLEPVEAGDVDAALALHRFDDDRRRLFQAAGAVLEHGFQIVGRVAAFAEIAAIRQRRRARHGNTGTAALGGIAGHRQRTQRHAVIGVGKEQHARPLLDLARDLERSFHRVGAGRPRELNLIFHAARLHDHVLEGFEELDLLCRGHVQAVGHAVGLDVFDQRGFHGLVVMTIVERAGAGEEVEVLAAVLGLHAVALGPGEHLGEGADIAADFGFKTIDDFHKYS